MRTKPLRDVLRTLPDREKMVGMKVFDEINEETLYIVDVECGIFCSSVPNGDFGHYYDIENLHAIL